MQWNKIHVNQEGQWYFGLYNRKDEDFEWLIN